MKFGIFSDIHIHPFNAFSKINADGINTRLLETVETLEKILDGAQKNKCDFVLFCGDMWHVKKIDAITLDLTMRALQKTQIPIILIPGNHEEMDALGKFHATRVLRGRVQILDHHDGLTTKINGLRIAGIPYAKNQDIKKLMTDYKGYDVLMLHTGITGALMGADFIADEESISLNDLQDAIGLVTAGHFHQSQLFTDQVYLPDGAEENYTRKIIPGKTVLIPGAPLQHGFGDEGSVRGWWLCDDLKTLSFQPINAPKFLKLLGSDIKNGLNGLDLSQVYATIISEDGKIDEQTAHELRGLKMIVEKKETKAEQRMSIDTSTSADDIIAAYVERMGKGDKQQLIRTGKDILNENQ